MTDSTAPAATQALPKTIAFIGGGNMAQALLGGLLASGTDPAALRVSDPSPACREALAALGPLAVFEDNVAAVDGAEAVVLAVKPQVLGPILTALAPVLATQPVTPFVLSIAAGIDCASLLHWSGGVPVVRAMPNTPALLRSGATALFATSGVSPGQRAQAEALMAMAGTTYWLEEEGDLAAVTAASGSGPAYFFRLMECMIDAAVAQGLTPALARALVTETALGAARMASAPGADPAALRAAVTSPGGTTAAALAAFEAAGFAPMIETAMAAAAHRANTLAEELGVPSAQRAHPQGDKA